jgi:hypothetical protein
MNISQVKKLRKIVRMKKLVTNNSKIFVCTMKKTSVNYRMVLTLLPCFYPLRHFKIYNSDLCISLFSILFKAVHWWLPLIPPAWSRGEEGIHSTPTVQYWSLPQEDEGWAGNHPQPLALSCKDIQHHWRLNIHLQIQQFSRWDSSVYIPYMMLLSKGFRCCMWNFVLLCNGVASYMPIWCNWVLKLSDVVLWCNSAMKSWLP